MGFNQSYNHIELRSYESQIKAHTHDFSQMVLPLSGALEITIGDRCGTVNDDTAAFIPSKIQHRFSGSSNNLFLVVDIDPQSRLIDRSRLPAFINIKPTVKKFLDFAHYYLTSESQFSTDGLIHTLLLDLMSQPFSSDMDYCVEMAKKWIDIHYYYPINTQNVAHHCNLSISQLQRRFKSVTGQGIAEYWRAQRLNQAKRLLSSGKLSIESIAFDVGYENLSAFSRRFNQTFGVSPSEWRDMTLSAKKMRQSDKGDQT